MIRKRKKQVEKIKIKNVAKIFKMKTIQIEGKKKMKLV